MASAEQELKYLKGANLNVEMFLPEAHKPLFTDPGYAAAYDWWPVIRNAVSAIKRTGGRLAFPRGRYRVAYDAGDVDRTSATGVIDLSPWLDGEVWTPTENIEIEFANGAVLWMDNLIPVESGLISEDLLGEELLGAYTQDAQTHAVYARCRWTDADGLHTPSTWNGYAVAYHGIKLVNVCVEWTRPAARGTGDSFHFAGTKSRDTAPYDLVLENCSAYNAPQVGVIFIGCRDSHAGDFKAYNCYADTVHFNACWDCQAGVIHAENCGDDTLAAVTYYPDVITLARGLDTEEGPFTSPDQVSANNNGLIVKGVQKIGGGAHGVRLLGAHGVQVGSVYVDADGSSNVSGVFAGAVKANGTTLAESGLACTKCVIGDVIARNGTQVGIHIVSQGVDGSEGDAWIVNDVAVKGGNVSDCAQVSVWAHDCDGYSVRGVKVDSVQVDIANSSKWTIAMECAGDVNISGHASYATDDMTTIPAGYGTIESLKMTGGRLLLSDFNTVAIKHFESSNAPGSAFEAIRVLNLIGPPLKVINANRSGTVDLAHIPVRFIPVHECNIGVDITHDSTPVQKFIEVGGGDSYNISRNIRVHAIVAHAVAALAGEDPFEIQGATYAPVNFYRTSRCWDGTDWTYVNTDDLPLGIVPEITAAQVSGVRTLKVFDALAVYATGVLNTLATALGTAAVYAARQIRFLQFAGDEGSAGVIDYGQLDADALTLHGRGTSSTNRKVKVYDTLDVNGAIGAVGMVTAPDVKVTNTTGNQPARLDADSKVKGGKIALTDAGDVSGASLTANAPLVWDGSKVASQGAFTANQNVITDGDGRLITQSLTADSPLITSGAGLPYATTWESVYNAIKSYIDTDFITTTDLATYTYSQGEIDTLLAGKAEQASFAAHTHSVSGTTGETSGHTHSVGITTSTP